MTDPRTTVPVRLGDAIIPLSLLVWMGIHTRNWFAAGALFGVAMLLNYLEWRFYGRPR